MKKIGILFHPKVSRSQDFAYKLDGFLSEQGYQSWICSSWDESKAKDLVNNTELIISVGGDGTLLRAARIVCPREIPILSYNFGNLGFMTELTANGGFEQLSLILDGKGWTDTRAMLKAEILSNGHTYHALNDVVIGRGRLIRLINVEVLLNNMPFKKYRADAVITATATGSTGYAMAANGPILYPESTDILLKSVCPHINLDKAFILSRDSELSFIVSTSHEAILSIDGQVEESLTNGERIRVTLSPHVTKLIRIQDKASYYSTIASRLKEKEL